MKKLLTLFLILFLTGIVVNAQQHRHRGMGKRMHEKFEQLEKIKLLEVLDMDEETSVRFISRRDDFLSSQREFIFQKDEKIKTLADKIKNGEKMSDAEYNKAVSEILSLEKNIFNARKQFVESVSDILSPEQIAKLVVFEYRFRRELMDSIMKQRRMGPPDG